MNTYESTSLDDLIAAKCELDRMKKRPSFGFKAIALAVLFGWVGMPVLAAATMNSIIPLPIRQVIVAANSAYSDLALGLQCKYKDK